MATRQIRVDDLDGKSEGADTIDFGVDGTFYEVDLADANAKKLRDALAPFIKAAREVQPKEALRRATNSNGAGYGSYDPSVVRAWATENGHQVSEKGRVPEDLVRKWRAAQAA